MLKAVIGRLLCRLGVHDFRIVSVSVGFGDGGNVEQARCRRCGVVTTRRA